MVAKRSDYTADFDDISDPDECARYQRDVFERVNALISRLKGIA